MHLRTITILITGLMLIATFIVPCILCVHRPPQSVRDIGDIWVLWVASGSPLVVSFILATILRHRMSSIILLVSTMTYSVWYASTLPVVSFEHWGAFDILYFLGVWSLPVMIPAWIISLIFDAYYSERHQTNKHLRTITIWMTGAMLMATVIIPCLLWMTAPIQSSGTLATFSFVWFTSGSPLIVSFILAIKTRYYISSIILFVTTIAYSICYACALPTVFDGYLGSLILLFIGGLSLPVMIPAWITVWLLNSRYV